MNKVMEIKELILNNPDGFSVNFSNLKALRYDNDSYCIAITDNRHKDLVKSIHSVVNSSKMFSQINGSLVLGGWYDKEDDKYCLDLVLREDNKEMALFMAKKFNQKSIFNLKTFEEIKNEDYKND